ncbi:MAG: XdhC family protein [Bosea sp. (in: a-proteobacteria)]|jgi:xanthine dehydrogenase accessory factor|uniref:XdhC family protein n=1 Tax=Bosea sp. (in: a-proteobacteria) TaxID=1871050 RepID=UPI003F7C164A
MGVSPADFTGTDILQLAAELSAAGRAFVLGVVVEAQGSSAGRTGAKALFDVEGEVIAGWVGGGCAESTVAHAAVEACATGVPQLVEVDLDSEVLGAGMPCGGRMRVYVEPVLPRPALWILGHGRVAECLCHFGALLGFAAIVDDTMAVAERFPEASRIITDDPDYAAVAPAARDFAVVATQHRGDHESLGRLLSSEVGHIALIASRKRAGLVLAYLRKVGFDRQALDRIQAPAGLALGARTPEEIALSVIAEIVLVRRSRAERVAAPQAGDLAATRAEPLRLVGRMR